MVKFTKTGFTLEVETAINPHEVYIETMEELIDIFDSQSDDMRTNRTYTTGLLRAMLPTVEQAKRMMPVETETFNGNLTVKRCAT